MQTKEINYSGKSKKLNKVIAELLPEISYNFFCKALRKADIKINGKRIKDNCVINNGDCIAIYGVPDDSFTPHVIYEDNFIIIFYKPKKISSEGDNSFEYKVNKFFNSNYLLCHRLDTNTDGLLIFVKNSKDFEDFKTIFKNHNIEKFYLALVYGVVHDYKIYKDYLYKDIEKSRVFIHTTQVPHSKEIITEVKPIKNNGEITVVEIKLITGKTHQIRAHLAHKGFPIIGDSKYGKVDVNKKFNQSRQLLTAYKVCFKNILGKFSYLNGKEIILDSKYITTFDKF